MRCCNSEVRAPSPVRCETGSVTSACVGLMDVPTDPKKEEVSHDDEYNGFAEDFGWDEAVASVATAQRFFTSRRGALALLSALIGSL